MVQVVTLYNSSKPAAAAEVIHIYPGRSLTRALTKDACLVLSPAQLELLETSGRLEVDHLTIRLHTLEVE